MWVRGTPYTGMAETGSTTEFYLALDVPEITGRATIRAMSDRTITPALVVHGGAGAWDQERRGPAREGCERASRAGLEVLAAGGEALDAVQAAVRVLERDPLFNAGVGCVLTRAGTAELDAAIMDGRRLRIGAVAAMPNAGTTIDIARAVLDDGEHVLLGGEAAWAFARERGFAPSDPGALVTERSRRRIAEEAARRSAATGEPDPGTVGACAIDARGVTAAATSTGGKSYKRIGRIGDTPLCGCGTYADDQGGASSATGDGEALIRVTATRFCVDVMRAGRTAPEAARAAIAELESRVGALGGIICCDREGRIGIAHNTESMPHAWASGERIVSGVAVDG